MQAAHSTRKPVASFRVAVVELLLLPFVPVAVVGVLVVAMFATEGAFEPPQPASATAAAARNASSPNLRQVVLMFMFRLSDIREQRRKPRVTAP